jgi:hypothetical protein
MAHSRSHLTVFFVSSLVLDSLLGLGGPWCGLWGKAEGGAWLLLQQLWGR